MAVPDINGGFILLARKMLTSGIMGKPSLHLKLWVWMLLQASHKDHGTLKRGQFFTNLGKMQRAMSYKIGYRKVTPTEKEVRGAYEGLVEGEMIGVTKGVQGVLITIRNYDRYQNPAAYEGRHEGRDEGSSKGEIKTRRDNKKEKRTAPAEILSAVSELRKRYSSQDLIDQAFQAFRLTRKSGKVSPSILLAQLQAWQKFPPEQVEAGIRTYLAKNYAGQGKREAYLLGIIRNQKIEAAPPSGSTGSALLDRYYREAEDGSG